MAICMLHVHVFFFLIPCLFFLCSIVLEKVAGVRVSRLPGATFSRYMLLEARSLAIEHLKEEIA